MGVSVEIKWGEQTADIWMCLTSGCVKYEEGKEMVYVQVEDKRSDGLRAERSVSLKKREGWPNYVYNIMNNVARHTGSEPKVDEGELLDIFRFASEKLKKGYWYIGIKSEFTTPRGIRVYFRVRSHEKSNEHHVVVELVAEKDGERLVYQVYGTTEKAHILLEEVSKAIGTYVLFSEYVTKQADQQND